MLSKLFGSNSKVKIMRLFLLNPEFSLNAKEVAARAKIQTPVASRELKLLTLVGFLDLKKGNKAKIWQLDPSFPLLSPLKNILKNDIIGRKKRLIQQFARCGKVNLLVISGVFLEDSDSRTDLLVVGTRLKRTSIARVVKDLEAEIGKELNYVVLETPDFQYRLNACDKFVRDVFDYPHHIILDKIGVLNTPTFLSGLSTVH